MTRLQTCSLIVLGSLIRCSTNSMSYPSYSHPPSSPSSFAPQGNSHYPTLVNSVPSAHCASALSLLACSMRAAGTMPMGASDGRTAVLDFVGMGTSRYVLFSHRHKITCPDSLTDPQDSHNAHNFFCSIFSFSLFRLSLRVLRMKPQKPPMCAW